MLSNPAVKNVYLALLAVELLVIGYDGLVTKSSLSEWIRIFVLAIAISSFYAWKTGVWQSKKWLWRFVFLLVCGWFVLYMPFEMYREKHLIQKMIEEFGLGVVAFGYVFFYAFHLPLLYALYSGAFRNLPATSLERSHPA